MTRWLGLLAALASASVSAALVPSRGMAQEMTFARPRGAAPGEEVELRCSGRGLSDLTSVLLFRDGLEVLEVKADRDDRATVRLRVRDDCPLGRHPFLLHTKRGITRIKLFHVGPLPSVQGVRDNLTAERAQKIELDRSVDGRVMPEETDWYAFDATEGQVVRVEIEGERLADTDFDPEVEVFDPDGALVARGDDSSLGKLDPILAVRCERAGTWRLAVRDVAYRGSTYAAYRLHLGTFPRPIGMVPCGGAPGATVQARFVGDGDPVDAMVTLPTGRGVVEWFPELDGRRPPTPIRVVIDARPCFVEGEASAEPPGAGCAFHGVVAVPGEEDRFEFRATKGERIEMRVLARGLGSPLDPVLAVRDASGKELAANDDSGGLDGRLRFTAPADGAFLACVRDQLGRGSADSFYRIEVGATDAGAATSEAIPGRRAEDLGVAVPQGGRAATLVLVEGLDARDGVDLGWDGLPAGVAVRGGRMQEGVPTVPLVFEAAPDAPLVAGLAGPKASAEKDPHERAVRHAHDVPLLRARGNDAVVQWTADRLPVAVTEPCPFAIEADVPKVPVVQGGPIALRFSLTRADGFDGTVAVRMLWTPPGLSAGTASLRKGEAEAVIQISARSNAAVGRWPVVLLASASVGGVERTVSSALVELEVQEPWLGATLPRVQLEQGASAVMSIALERRRAFEGEVTAELGRLPNGVTAVVPAIAADTTQLDVALTAAADAQVGRQRYVYLKLRVATPDGDVVHVVGSGEIRVDQPLPPRTDARGGTER